LVLLCRADSRGADGSASVQRCLVKPVMPDQLLTELAALFGAAQPNDLKATGATPDSSGGLAQVPAAGREARILLAEDNAVNQKVAVRMLEKLGCRIDVAGDGAEAVEMWRHFAYDAIFMDCQMPELDGLEAARLIRREELRLGRDRAPIIAMTANAMAQDRSDCLAAGMDDYLSKPVRQEDLQATLDRWLNADAVRVAGAGGDGA
jgi:two-component system, sensor histidine kinase and response regulator